MRRFQFSLPWLAIGAMLALVCAVSAAGPAPASGLALRFVPLDPATRSAANGDAIVDFGAISAGPHSDRRGIVVRQRIAVRLDGIPGASGSASVSVALSTEIPGCTVRLDGVTLSTVPRMIQASHRIGAAVTHELEVTIPPTAPEGPFLSDLQWSVTSE